MEKADILLLLQTHVRAVEQRGVGNLNADYPYLFSKTEAYPLLCDALIEEIKDLHFDYIASIETLGFPMAGAIAHARRVGFVSIRKGGALPGAGLQSESFTVPYKKRETILEIQKDIPFRNKRVLLFDEAIDTGASLTQAVRLLQKAEAQVIAILTLTNYPNIHEIEGVKVLSLAYGPF